MTFAFKKMYPRNLYNYEVDQELGGGELSSSTCPGVGNKPPGKKKLQMGWGGGGGGGM